MIRTAVLLDGELSIGGGGAIVLDSDPESEYREMLLKIATALRGLCPAGLASMRAGRELGGAVRP